MKNILTAVFFNTILLFASLLCASGHAADENRNNFTRQWHNTDQIKIQGEYIKPDNQIGKELLQDYSEDYLLVISDRLVIRRLLSVLRQHRKLFYEDDHSVAGNAAYPSSLVISLRSNGQWTNWWTLWLSKRRGCYPLTFQHNTRSRNDLQLSYTSVPPSQMSVFLHILHIASRRAHRNEKGYRFEEVSGI